VHPNDGKDKLARVPCKIYAEDHMTYRYPCLQEFTNFFAKKDTSRIPAFPNNPFLAQHQYYLIENQIRPLQGGNGGSQHLLVGEGSSTI